MLDAGLRPRPFPDDTASLLPGLLTATRTGLSPASDDELTNQPSTIHTINHQPWFDALPPPYVIAIVELQEQAGLRMTTNIVGCRPEVVHAGMAVAVCFEPLDAVWLPWFRPQS